MGAVTVGVGNRRDPAYFRVVISDDPDIIFFVLGDLQRGFDFPPAESALFQLVSDDAAKVGNVFG